MHLWTTEMVLDGHPDKVADQISDAILDDALSQDPESKVACETVVNKGLVFVTGQITTAATIDVDKIAREVLTEIGYINPDYGIDASSCAVLSSIVPQSPDIALGVHEGSDLFKEADQLGAGDSGMVIGYATDETPEMMPLGYVIAREIAQSITRARKTNALPYLRPDGKIQVTTLLDPKTKRAASIHSIVISIQHAPWIKRGTIVNDMKSLVESLGYPVPQKFYVNPTGQFVTGGPEGDTGLTGRKIMVDTYGGYVRHGGGAFSGKDPSKVDRSGAYMARRLAKQLVKQGMYKEVEIQIGFVIGKATPVSVAIIGDDPSTDKSIEAAAMISTEDLSVQGIINKMGLTKPSFSYKNTAAFGHFGRKDLQLPWE